MKKITFSPMTRVERKIKQIPSWPAYQSETSGLCVHRAIAPLWETPGEVGPGDTWDVSHIGSGYRVDDCRWFTRRKDAEEMAVWLGGLTDWTQDMDRIVRSVGRADRDRIRIKAKVIRGEIQP